MSEVVADPTCVKRPRRKLQFGLRFLFAVMLLFAAVLGAEQVYQNVYIRYWYPQEFAARQLHKIGGAATWEGEDVVVALLPDHVRDVRGGGATDEDVVLLVPFPCLTQINAARTQLTGETFGEISHLNKLTSLRLDDSHSTDRGASHLVNFQELETLNLNNTDIGDGALVAIGQLRKLRSLFIAGTHVTDDGLAYLSSLPCLDRVMLSNTRITDAGLGHLKKIATLETLWVDGTNVTPKGLRQLERTLGRSLSPH